MKILSSFFSSFLLIALFFLSTPVSLAEILTVEAQTVRSSTDNDYIKIYNYNNKKESLNISDYKISISKKPSVKVFPLRGIRNKTIVNQKSNQKLFQIKLKQQNNNYQFQNKTNGIQVALSSKKYLSSTIISSTPLITISKSATLTKTTATTVEDKKIIEKINLNTASFEELQNLSGIGKTLAQKIIQARPFYSVEDLEKVQGIGSKIMEKIKKQNLAWVNPNLKPKPLIDKNTETASKSQFFNKNIAPYKGGKESNRLPLLLIALSFSFVLGILFLFIKNILNKD